IVKSLSFGITDAIRAMVKFGKASTETLEVRRKFHSKRHNREIRQNRYLRHNRFPLLKLFVSRNIVSIQCRFEKSNGIPKILRGATRQPRATGSNSTATGDGEQLDSHGRQPRATATGDSDGAGRRGATRQPRATATGDGEQLDSHGRQPRATATGDGEQLDSHGRQPRATATGDSHGAGRRGRATGPGDGE